jgi:hypothetical protein
MEPRTEIVPVALADGTTIQIQATALGGEEEVAFGVLSFDDVRQAIRGIAREIGGVLAEVQPRKASVEFGLEVGIAAGQLTALWVKGTGTASMKITLEWDKASPPPASP